MRQTNSKKTLEEAKQYEKQQLLKKFNGIEIKTCSMCGAFLTIKEHKENEGVCAKHWDM